MRILVVEDERRLLGIITKQLKKKGYSVDAVDNGLEAEGYLGAADYDCVVLDRMLPGKNGTDILRDIRRSGNTVPVLLLTAMDSINDRVNGLDAGADDYLVKPFSFDELFARVRALTRRNSKQKSTLLQIADLELDTASQKVRRGGQDIHLSTKEYMLLEYMMHNLGIVLSRDQIIEHIWNFDYECGSNVVDVYIRYLRRKIDDGHGQVLIHTLRGRGYVLREES
ncbi:MAG: response regulator transcription factor [Actinomycetia bacterium]|nr:response regulator transcription factor [Actinomycetes bacterium]